MNLFVENFNKEFHNLEGITLGEKRRSLSALLRKTSKSKNLPSQIDTLVATIAPKSNLESLFRVHVLIHFQRIEETIDVLKSENWIFISHILKQRWFFQKLINAYKPEMLVKELFPALSYVVRMKLMNKIAVHICDKDYIDLLFDIVFETYGIDHALPLISGCNSEKIRLILEENEICLNASCLLKIARKDVSTIEFYADLCKSRGNNNFSCNDEEVLKYLIINDIEAFCRICEKHQNFVRCGKRTTYKLLKCKKELVLKSSQRYSRMLSRKGLMKGLQNDFLEFYVGMLPDKIDYLQHPFDKDKCFVLLNRFPKNKQMYIINEAFKRKWNVNVFDLPELLSPKLVELFLGLEGRVKFAEEMLSKDESCSEIWIVNLETNKAIDLIKHKITVTSYMYERRDLINMLVKVCKINKNLGALVEVCKYFINRHRNDDISIHKWFLSELMNNFQLELLSEEHWKYLNEIISIIKLNKPIYYDMVRFLTKNIHYCLMRNLPVETVIQEYCEVSSNYNIIEEATLQKHCFLLFYETVFKLYGNNRILKLYDVNLMSSIINWNMKHPNNKIEFREFPRLDMSLQNLLSDGDSDDINKISIKNILEYMLCKESAFFNKECYIEIYFKHLELYHSERINLWILCNKPESFVKHLESFSVLKIYSRSEYYFCKKYSHLGIPEKIILYLKKILNESIKEDLKVTAIANLTMLMNSGDCAEFLCSYYPENEKVDLHSEEKQVLYKIQRSVALNLKHLMLPSEALQLLLKFCCGDYLRSALESLYYLFYRTPENKLIHLIYKLIKSSVSVRKHVIFIVPKIMSRLDVFKQLEMFTENENDISMKKYLLKTIFAYLKRNPSDKIWELLKMLILCTDKKDEETFTNLINNVYISEKYVPKYIELVWNILGTSETEFAEKQKFRLLRVITPNVHVLLSSDFCDSIVKEYFTLSQNREIENFTIGYLLYCHNEHELNKRLELVFATLMKLINCEDIELELVNHKCMYSFVESLCLDSISLTRNNILNMFIDRWDSFFKRNETFGEYLFLQITRLYFCSLDEGLNSFGIKVATFLDDVIYHDIYIVDIFVAVLSSLTYKIFEKFKVEEDLPKIKFLESIYKTTNSTATTLLVIKLLSEVNDFEETCYTSLYQDLRKKNDPIVQVFLNDYINSLITY